MTTESLLLSFAILASSFWGSWHCAAMCGPVASLMANRKSLLQYQLGRGLSYMALGGFGGYVGSYFLNNNFYYLRLISGILFALILIIIGFQTFYGRKQQQPGGFSFLHSFYSKSLSGLTLGLLSVFLPCGWLYSYFFAAVATKSPDSGMLVMGIFWLGGLPALSAVSIFVKQSITLSTGRKQKISGLILVSAGLYSVFSFFFLNGLGR